MAAEPTPDIDEDIQQSDEDHAGDPPNPDVNDEGDEGDEEEVPTFGDTVEEEKDTDNATIRHLRTTLRETQKELVELRRSAPQSQSIEVGEKPTLAGCDYDEDKYEAELDGWKERKAAADSQKTVATQSAEEQRKAWDARLEKVTAEKAALARDDADDAFETVSTALGENKFAGMLSLLDDGTNSAAFIYALSKNPAQLAALGAQVDPIKLVKEITRLEGQLKMVKRRTPPNPDTPERGSGKISHEAADKKLARLEKEADRTGERTELVAYKKQLETAAKTAAKA